jgi:hypothetical protein
MRCKMRAVSERRVKFEAVDSRHVLLCGKRRLLISVHVKEQMRKSGPEVAPV